MSVVAETYVGSVPAVPEGVVLAPNDWRRLIDEQAMRIEFAAEAAPLFRSKILAVPGLSVDDEVIHVDPTGVGAALICTGRGKMLTMRKLSAAIRIREILATACGQDLSGMTYAVIDLSRGTVTMHTGKHLETWKIPPQSGKV